MSQQHRSQQKDAYQDTWNHKKAAAALAGAVLLEVLISVMGFPESYRVGLEVLWLACCASRFGFLEIRMGFFVSIFYAAAVSLWQFLFAAWLGVLFHSAAWLEAKTERGQIALWIFHVLLSAVVLYFYVQGAGGKKCIPLRLGCGRSRFYGGHNAVGTDRVKDCR